MVMRGLEKAKGTATAASPDNRYFGGRSRNAEKISEVDV